MQGGVTISVAGGLDSGVTYQLDGAMHNNPYDGTNCLCLSRTRSKSLRSKPADLLNGNAFRWRGQCRY